MRIAAWSLRRRLAVVLSTTAILLLALVTFASVVLVGVHRDQKDVTDRYYQILSDGNTLFLGLLDAETAVRGYVLTGNEATLEPLRALSSPDYQSRGAELRQMIARYPALAQKLARTSDTASSWYQSFVVPSISKVRTSGPRSVSAAAIDAGKVQFDAIRAQYTDYRNAVLAKRTATNKALGTKTTLLFVAVLLAAVGALFVAALLSFTLRRWVTRPIETLAGQTRGVRAGELSQQISVDGPPEIVGLGSDVDAMRQRLVEQLVQVEAVRDGLQAAQSKLEASAAELERSNRDLEQFAYVASHDLQEPLRKVASFCQLLERRYAGQLDERADQYIAFAVDGAKRMQQLINDLLAFSRIGRRTTGRDEVPLDGCLAGALRNLETVLEETGATVTAPELPTVWGEKALLTALLQNLVSNAIKFRGEQPAVVRLSVEPHVSDDGEQPEEYLFRCSDNGIGIEPQYAERIFVIFQRLHGKDEYAGTGIGLAMCKKIVEWHGGRIWLDTDASGPGVGTTFAWTLPTVDRGRALMDPVPEQAGARAGGAAGEASRSERETTQADAGQHDGRSRTVSRVP